MVPLFYLALFVAVSYWKHAFSLMSLVVSGVAVPYLLFLWLFKNFFFFFNFMYDLFISVGVVNSVVTNELLV